MMSGKNKLNDDKTNPAKKQKLNHNTNQKEVEEIDMEEDIQNETNNGPFITRFTSVDLNRYYKTLDDKNDYDGLISLVNLTKKDLSLESIELINKNNAFYLYSPTTKRLPILK